MNSGGGQTRPAESDSGGSRPAGDQRETTRWINDIPFDIYWDRPLEIARDTQTVATSIDSTPSMVTPPATTGTPSATPPPSTTPPPATSTSSAVDWPQVLPMELLNEEVKQIRTRLTANLQTVATFNREQEATKLDAVVLAGLASIALMHPEEVNWKEKAPHIRDLAFVIFQRSSSTGREPFAACQEAFEQIQTMLDGGPAPADLQAVPERSPAEVADRFDLMYRFRQTSSHLKSNINSEARLKEDLEGVRRELSVLAGLAALIGTDTYSYALEPEYQGYIAAFVEAAMAARTGVELQSFPQFSQGIADIQKTCNSCHQQYAFGTEAGI